MKDEEEKKIVTLSIIVPVYNSARQLGKCLEALSAARDEQMECIVVDDGSTDQSAEVARQFGARVLSTGGRCGPAVARNLGAQAARGPVLLFVDADVCVAPDVPARVLAALAADPQLTAVMGSYDDTPEAQNFLSQYRNLMHCYTHQTGQLAATTFWSGCGAIRRSVFMEFGGFDSRKYSCPSIEDIELGYRLTKAGHKIVLDRGILCKHLKQWTFANMVETDVFHRGIPWTELILRDRMMPNDLNLQLSHRVSVMSAALLMLMAFVMAARWGGTFLAPLLAALLILLGRYWAESVGRGPTRWVWAGGFAAVSLLAVSEHMFGLIPPVFLAYYATIMRHRYESHGKSLLLRSLSGYLALSVVFALTYLPRHPLMVLFFAVLTAMLFLNRNFYVFLAARRGFVFTVGAIPFHLLFHLYNGVSFLLGTLRHCATLWVYGVKAPARSHPPLVDGFAVPGSTANAATGDNR